MPVNSRRADSKQASPSCDHKPMPARLPGSTSARVTRLARIQHHVRDLQNQPGFPKARQKWASRVAAGRDPVPLVLDDAQSLPGLGRDLHPGELFQSRG